MARKNFIKSFKAIDSVPMNINFTGEYTDVNGLDNISYHATWTVAATQDGDFVIEGTNDSKEMIDQGSAIWTPLEFNSLFTIPFTSTAGENGAIISINQFSMQFIRPGYIAGAGDTTGILTMKLNARQIGG